MCYIVKEQEKFRNNKEKTTKVKGKRPGKRNKNEKCVYTGDKNQDTSGMS